MIARQNKFADGIGEARFVGDSLGIRLRVEYGNRGLDDSNSAGCVIIVLVRVSYRPLTI
jgi:hypothetical protein